MEGKFPSPPSILLGGNFPSHLLTLSVTSQIPSLDQSMVRPNGKAVFNSTTHSSSGFCLEEERGDGCCVGTRGVCHATPSPPSESRDQLWVQSSLEELWSGYLYHLTEFWLGVFVFCFCFVSLVMNSGRNLKYLGLAQNYGSLVSHGLLGTGFSLLHSGTF